MILPAGAGIAAAGIGAYAAVSPTSQLFGSTLCHTSRPSAMALTFDDGPNPAITPQLLALLDRHSARATFFLVGRFARACPHLVREIAARGHLIGNHTETHANLAWLFPKRIGEELQQCQASIAAALAGELGGAQTWMRPPFGYRGPQLAGAVRRAGLRGVAMWSRPYYDWKLQPPARLIARLARAMPKTTAHASREPDAHKRAHAGGPIVLLHDGDFRQLGADRRHVLAALEHWLPRWRDAGLEFVTIDGAASTH
jgi:peptidoglycan/xylan/chitin deacetylase (PgdA/CDA1 family)